MSQATQHNPDAGETRHAAILRGQKEALELAVHGAPLRSVLEVIVGTVEKSSTQGVLGSILLLDEDGKHLRLGAAPSLDAAYNAAIDGITIGPDVGSCGTAAYTRETVVVRDIQTDPLWKNFKDLAGSHGLRACWSAPIFSSTHRVLGTFALYHRVATVPSDADRSVVELLGHTASVVIERDLESRRRAAADEEVRRVREEAAANMAVLFEHAPAAIAVLRGPEHVFESANPGYLALVGGREVVGRTVREALPEVVEQGFPALLDGVRQSGKPYIGRATKVLLENRGRGKPEERMLDFVYQPVPGGDGNISGILVVAFDVTDLVRAREQAEQRAADLERQLAQARA